MTRKTIRKILILGGGTAGWMTAAFLARWINRFGLEVVLAESEQIGTIGVGEATVPGIHQFLRDLEINEAEFIKATHATFKLGIEFDGWSAPGQRFFHPFAGYGVQIEERAFHQTWWAAQQQGYGEPLDAFCLCTQLARRGKFAQPSFDEASRLAWYNYAYHFDASLFARFLRVFAENLGVRRVEGKLARVTLDEADGYISAIQLESGEVLGADLFVDCTGMSALLIGKALGVGYEDWSHWLASDSALAVQTSGVVEPDPFTRSTARSAGWQWHIPLQHRVGNGYVFSSRFIDPGAAEAELRVNLRGEPLTEPRLIRFTTGLRKDFWRKNCVAIGLSSGFLEPLESTSISLIQTGISKMAAFLEGFILDEQRIAEANRLNRLEYERIRDFIILHYKLNQRPGDYWRYVREMEIPTSLGDKIEHFKRSAVVPMMEQESFREESWVSLFFGFGLAPLSLAQSPDSPRAWRLMDKMKTAIDKGCELATSHAEFLKTINS